MYDTAPILCRDYDVGPFHPVSFDPRYKWNITSSNDFSSTKTNVRYIRIETTSPNGYKMTLQSSPYSFGWFSVECRSLGFGGKGHWLDTNDPEDAIYRAELYFSEFIKDKINFWSNLKEVL
jgi:hypothetical protein